MPLAHQIPILASPARYKLPACGRRFGKTSLCLSACLRGHGPYRGALPGAVDKAKIGWFAPTFTILAEIWDDLKRATTHAWIDKSESEHKIILPGGGSVQCRSLDNPDNARGPGYDGIVIDEAAFVKEEAWTTVLRPTLADRGGWAILPSTPNGKNWYWRLFEAASTRPDWEAWQLPTSANPLIPPEELEQAQLDMGPRAFSQEHEAQFMDIEGAEWPGHFFNDIWFDEWPRDLRLRVLALDPSKGATDKSDYSAFILLGLSEDGTMYVDADLERRDTSAIVTDGMRICDRWRPQSFVVESNQFDGLLAGQFIEQSRGKGIGLPIRSIYNYLNKVVRIRATITPFLSRGEIRIRRTRGGKMLADQLQTFPEAPHDDGPDALEMAISEVKRLFYEHSKALSA